MNVLRKLSLLSTFLIPFSACTLDRKHVQTIDWIQLRKDIDVAIEKLEDAKLAGETTSAQCLQNSKKLSQAEENLRTILRDAGVPDLYPSASRVARIGAKIRARQLKNLSSPTKRDSALERLVKDYDDAVEELTKDLAEKEEEYAASHAKLRKK